MTSAEYSAEGKIEYPGERVVGLRQDITAKNVGRREPGPKLRDYFSHAGEIIAASSQSGAVDGSGGSSTNDRKRIPLRLNPFNFADAFQHTGLISSPGAAARHDQTESVLHPPDPLRLTHPPRSPSLSSPRATS